MDDWVDFEGDAYVVADATRTATRFTTDMDHDGDIALRQRLIAHLAMPIDVSQLGIRRRVQHGVGVAVVEPSVLAVGVEQCGVAVAQLQRRGGFPGVMDPSDVGQLGRGDWVDHLVAAV